MNRLVTAVVSVALLGFTPAALSTSASAAAPEVTAAESAAPDARAARTISISYGNRGRQAFIKGGVKPRYAKRVLIVQKRKCGGGACTYKFYKKTRTNAKSKYKVNVFVPRRGKAGYRVMIKPTSTMGPSYSKPVLLYWR
ncbi:hypothetical protein [Nocardioides pacificus]